MKYFFSLILLAICSQVALATDNVRIGVFWLYDIRTIQASPVDKPITISHGAQNFLLTTGHKLVVQREGDNLLCSISDVTGRTIQQWRDHDITLNEGDSSGSASLSIPGKIVRTFRGTIAIKPAVNVASAPKTEIRIILETDRENAIAAIAASEMPVRAGKADLQSLKSLSVVIRTFMIGHPHRHTEEGFDYCDSTHCQHYQGEDFTSRIAGRLAKQAANETRGSILSFEGKPIEAYFTGACGGITTTPQIAWGTIPSGAYSYYVVKCKWCRGSHFYRWERHVDAGKLFDATAKITGLKLTGQTRIETVEADNGFVLAIRVTDGPQVATISISKFRSDLGRVLGWNTVISNAFTMERRGSEFVIRGRGFGHNVGLCVEGALRQSETGRDWKTILSYYFPHTEIGAPQVSE